jgi:PelA/Pel-15E family pectate lyase
MFTVILKKLFAALLFAVALTAPAALLGTNHPALPLTLERIATLPAAQQPAWRDYLERSAKQKLADQKFLHDEMKAAGLSESKLAPHAKNFSGLSLTQQLDWYALPEARRLANIIVSFQTPAGGWSKRLDLTKFSRTPGQHFAPDNTSRFLTNTATDNDAPHEARWSYVGTFDNDATTTQLRFLARVIAATKVEREEKLCASFARGLDYIFAAQNPQGGWPQSWPLDGGYHDAITFNDGAMIHLLEFLRDVSDGQNEFSFTSPALREKAAASFQKGIACILATQITDHGQRTVWCQQHDALTLAPCAARNYEMPAACGAESAGILLFLLKIPAPDTNVVAAVDAAAAWLIKAKLPPDALAKVGKETKRAVEPKTDGSLWARYYELGSTRPIFGDRDLSIHDNVTEISAERRKGYSWFTDHPKRVLAEYERWTKRRAKSELLLKR